jgi:hypothetical protein
MIQLWEIVMAEPTDFAGYLGTLEGRIEQLENQFSLVISPPSPTPNLEPYASYIIQLEARVKKLEQGH